MMSRPKFRNYAYILVCALLAGCAKGEPFDPPTAGEIPPGPGLFSGKAGAFYITGGPEARDGDTEESKKTRPTPKARN